MYVMLIISAAFVLIELLILAAYLTKKKNQKKKAGKSLYKLMENNVLTSALRLRISEDQAVCLERQKSFLYIEFPQTKPFVSYLYNLDECITIGRSKENKICIRDEELSRLHCKISFVQGGLYLMDMGSANRTLIRRGLFGKYYLKPGQQTKLCSGDTIFIGRYQMKIHIYCGNDAIL